MVGKCVTWLNVQLSKDCNMSEQNKVTKSQDNTGLSAPNTSLSAQLRSSRFSDSGCYRRHSTDNREFSAAVVVKARRKREAQELNTQM